MTSVMLLARHGRTSWNVTGRIQGHGGAGLDAVGRGQAQTMALELAINHPQISLVISSDLLRAQQTANIVADVLKVPAQEDRRLRECGFGELEGLTHPEALDRHGKELGPHLSNHTFAYDFQRFGGERRDQVVARLQGFVDELRADDKHQTVLVISHGRCINNFLMAQYSTISAITDNCQYRIVPL